MSKHTPGPWKWGEGWKQWDETPWDTRTEYSGPKYLEIALKGRGREIIPIRIDHYQIEWDAYNGIGDLIPADRALIAAAPDLLEACKAMLECEYGTDEARRAIQMCKAAVRKAETT